MAQTDPFAAIATPVQTPAAAAPSSSDPFASIATPLPESQDAPPQGIWEHIKDVGVGVAKGAGDTLLSGAHLVPMGAEGKQFLQQLDDKLAATNTEQKVGKGIETGAELAATAGASSEITMVKELELAEKLTGAARAAKYVDLARKYPVLADTFNLATNHPWLSKMILEGGKGAVAGGVEGAVKQRTAKGTAEGAAIGAGTGAAIAAAPILFNPFKKAGSAVWDAVSGTWKNATEATSRAISPTAAAQPELQAAFREGATTSAADAGATLPVSPRGTGVRTLMAQPIEAATKIEDNLYATVNKAAETDMKSLYDNREALQDAIDDPLQVANKQKLQMEMHALQTKINWAEDNVRTKLGANASDLISKAKAATQQRYAMETGDAKLFNNESIVKGNVAHGGAETLNVENAIRQAELLDKPSKFAPRGSPTRLQQMFGTKGAADFKQGLYDAKKSGQTVLTRNKVLAWLAGSATVGGTAWDLLQSKN